MCSLRLAQKETHSLHLFEDGAKALFVKRPQFVVKLLCLPQPLIRTDILLRSSRCVLLCIIRVEDQLKEVGQSVLDAKQIRCSLFEFAGVKRHVDRLIALGEIVK